MTNIKYKDKFSLSARISESNRILSKHPEHVPVIVEVMNTKRNVLYKTHTGLTFKLNPWY